MKKLIALLNLKSIQTKMMLAILVLVVLPMLLITFISFTNSERFIHERIKKTDSQTLSQLSSTINSALEDMIQAQINPHFLFNTLNTIKWTAIISQANNVASLIEALGKILEMSVKDIHALISVQDEVENLKNYLCLQRARYNQRFTEKIQIDDSLNALKIPELVLQPLVENSIIHGMKKENAGNLNIEINGRIEGGHLVLVVHDRSIVPPGAQNVLCCGRMLDADRGAFGAVRVMVNLNQTGEAAGVAAYLALDSGKTVDSVPVGSLREALQAGGSIVL